MVHSTVWWSISNMNNAPGLILPSGIKCFLDASKHILWRIPSTSGTKSINERSYYIWIRCEVKALNVWIVLMVLIADHSYANFSLAEECEFDVVDDALNLLFGCIDMS